MALRAGEVGTASRAVPAVGPRRLREKVPLGSRNLPGAPEAHAGLLVYIEIVHAYGNPRCRNAGPSGLNIFSLDRYPGLLPPPADLPWADECRPFGPCKVFLLWTSASRARCQGLPSLAPGMSGVYGAGGHARMRLRCELPPGCSDVAQATALVPLPARYPLAVTQISVFHPVSAVSQRCAGRFFQPPVRCRRHC